jgi:Protein of unknown function (DUF3037)
VERQEFINVGVILFCLQENFLGARVQWNPDRLRVFAHNLDLGDIKRHLEAYPKICDGLGDSGPIGRLTRRERFHWLVAPRSTIIQVSSVHSGICMEPALVLQKLFERLVL